MSTIFFPVGFLSPIMDPLCLYFPLIMNLEQSCEVVVSLLSALSNNSSIGKMESDISLGKLAL